VAERIYLFPEVRSVYLASGTYDLLLVVQAVPSARSPTRLAEAFPRGRRAGHVTHFVLKRYKEDGDILKETAWSSASPFYSSIVSVELTGYR